MRLITALLVGPWFVLLVSSIGHAIYQRRSNCFIIQLIFHRVSCVTYLKQNSIIHKRLESNSWFTRTPNLCGLNCSLIKTNIWNFMTQVPLWSLFTFLMFLSKIEIHYDNEWQIPHTHTHTHTHTQTLQFSVYSLQHPKFMTSWNVT